MKRILLQIWRFLPAWLQRLASTIILSEPGQSLLSRHTYRRRHSWSMPGGCVKYGEDPPNAVRRKLREETGLPVRETRLLLVESSKDVRKINLTYLCPGIRGAFIPNEEVSMIKYFDTGALPAFSREHQVTIEKALIILKAGWN